MASVRAARPTVSRHSESSFTVRLYANATQPMLALGRRARRTREAGGIGCHMSLLGLVLFYKVKVSTSGSLRRLQLWMAACPWNDAHRV